LRAKSLFIVAFGTAYAWRLAPAFFCFPGAFIARPPSIPFNMRRTSPTGPSDRHVVGYQECFAKQSLSVTCRIFPVRSVRSAISLCMHPGRQNLLYAFVQPWRQAELRSWASTRLPFRRLMLGGAAELKDVHWAMRYVPVIARRMRPASGFAPRSLLGKFSGLAQINVRFCLVSKLMTCWRTDRFSSWQLGEHSQQ